MKTCKSYQSVKKDKNVNTISITVSFARNCIILSFSFYKDHFNNPPPEETTWQIPTKEFLITTYFSFITSEISIT